MWAGMGVERGAIKRDASKPLQTSNLLQRGGKQDSRAFRITLTQQIDPDIISNVTIRLEISFDVQGHVHLRAI